MDCTFQESQIQKIYKSITGQDLKTRVNPSQFCNYLQNSIKFDRNEEFEKKTQGYVVQGFLGTGSYGFVLKYVNPQTKRRFAMKFLYGMNQEQKDEALREVKMQDLAHKAGIALELIPNLLTGTILLHEQLTRNGRVQKFKIYAMAMDIMEKTVQQAIQDATLNLSNISDAVYFIIDLLKSLYKMGVLHADLHVGNMAIKDSQLKLIDFGMARMVQYPWEGFMDFIQLIWSIKDISCKFDKKYCDKLATILMICSNYLYGSQFTDINKFSPHRNGGGEYEINSNIILMSAYPLNRGGIQGNCRGGCNGEFLKSVWPTLKGPDIKDFDFILDTVKHSGVDFMLGLMKANLCINLNVRR